MAKSTEPLRGEAAWRAAKKEIAARNELAYARGRRVRELRNAEAHRLRLENDQQSTSELPRPRGR